MTSDLFNPDELEEPRRIMYDELVDLLGEERVKAMLQRQVRDAITEAYDQREQLAQQAKQADRQ